LTFLLIFQALVYSFLFFLNLVILIKVSLCLADKKGITNLKNASDDERTL